MSSPEQKESESISLDDLLKIIGAKEVRNIQLSQRVMQLEAEVAELKKGKPNGAA